MSTAVAHKSSMPTSHQSNAVDIQTAKIAESAKASDVTALYLRISLDDDNTDESDSIVNQRDLLSAYVAADPTLSAGEVLTFVDDGYSGTNFNRPQVKALLELVKRGGIQNILVKDLSRWGRNYPEVNEYLDQIFPFLGVRFISVNDQYDSIAHKGQTAPMGVAFSSIVHDIYSKELSAKVSQAHLAKAKKGEYVHGSNFYGYVRCAEKKNRLVVDDVAAVVVRLIFDMACEGMSTNEIAAALNAEGVDAPLTHRIKNGHNTKGMRTAGDKAFWNYGQILRMLKDERYTGTLVSHKYKVISPGSKKRKRLEEHEWVKVPNAHKAIISAEQFAKGQSNLRTINRGGSNNNSISNKVISNNAPQSISANRSPFIGKVICGHCKRVMAHYKTINAYHLCPSIKMNTGLGCYDGNVYVNDLSVILLAAVKLEAQSILDLHEHPKHQALQQYKKLYDNQSQGYTQIYGSPAKYEKEYISSEFKKLTANVTLLEQRSMSLYEEFAEGKVDKDAYVTAKAKNSTDLEAAQNRIAELNQRLAEIEATSTAQSNIANDSVLHRVLAATEVTAEVMSLVDRIIVYDNERIEVQLAFGDSLKFTAIEISEERKGD